MDKIDIVTTSTIRPEILDQTYSTFLKHIFCSNDRYRLLINIDPIGDRNKRVDDVIEVAKQYFDDIVINSPDEPGFTKAVIWLWSHTSSDYVFHLEDDWVLRKRINIDYMMSILDRYDKICSIRLSKGAVTAGKKVLRSFPCPYIEEKDRGKFRLFPRLSLNPTLFRGQFVRDAAKVMTTKLNPESQLVYGWAAKKERKKQLYLNADKIGELLLQWDHSVLTAHSSSSVIKDIGHSWRRKHRVNRSFDFMYWG